MLRRMKTVEINMLQALSNFKTNSVKVKGNGTEGDFLKSLNNLINSEEFNGEENIEAENIPNVKVDIEDLLNIEFNEDIKTAENIIVNEEVKSDKNIEIKDVIQSYEKDELIEFVEDNKEDDLNKIDENLIILANRIFNNISYKEKQQFDITEDNADFKNNTQMDMNIVNNNVNKQQEIVDNLIAFVESSSNKDNIQNKIDFIKKTFDFNEVKSKLTDLVESNFNLQNSKDEFTNNVEKSLDFASELEAISNFKVLSMKDNIKVNDSKNEINFLKNWCKENNYKVSFLDGYLLGADGSKELSYLVKEELQKESHFQPLYSINMPTKEKIEKICKEIYRADDVEFSKEAEEDLKKYHALGFDHTYICMAKTPNSFSDDPLLLNAPRGFKIHIRKVNLSSGANFLIPLPANLIETPYSVFPVPSCCLLPEVASPIMSPVKRTFDLS